MEKMDHRMIKVQARQCLEQERWAYRKTVLLHSAVTAAVLVLVALLDLLLSYAVSHTGGLSGISTRSILETVRSVLSTASNILLPFWSVGILYTSIRTVRRQTVDGRMLTQGFQRFGPLLRQFLLWMVLYIGLAMVCANATMVLTMFLPASETMSSILSRTDITDVEGYAALFADLSLEEMLQAILPALCIFLVLYCAVLVYLHYRFRMSQYLLVDEPRMGALASFAISNRMTKGYKRALFRLDLSFWWYYLLMGLVSLTVYVPEILSLFGIVLPLSTEITNLLFYLVYTLLSLLLSWWAGAYVQASYAQAYTELLQKIPGAQS